MFDDLGFPDLAPGGDGGGDGGGGVSPLDLLGGSPSFKASATSGARGDSIAGNFSSGSFSPSFGGSGTVTQQLPQLATLAVLGVALWIVLRR